jgi:hypothetical protein
MSDTQTSFFGIGGPAGGQSTNAPLYYMSPHDDHGRL